MDAGGEKDSDETQAAHRTLHRAFVLRRWTMLDDGDDRDNEQAGGEAQGGHADAESISRDALHPHRHGAQGQAGVRGNLLVAAASADQGKDFLLSWGQVGGHTVEVAQGLAVTGHFLSRALMRPDTASPLPEARGRLLDHLSQAKTVAD